MKLYLVPLASAGERWHSSKTGLKAVVEIELPKEGRQGMATFLNEHEREIVDYGIAERITVSGPSAEDQLEALMSELAPPAAPAYVRPASRVTTDRIVEHILDEATVNEVADILSAIGTRFGEMVRR